MRTIHEDGYQLQDEFLFPAPCVMVRMVQPSKTEFIPFRIDTGADLTHIPLSFAERLRREDVFHTIRDYNPTGIEISPRWLVTLEIRVQFNGNQEDIQVAMNQFGVQETSHSVGLIGLDLLNHCLMELHGQNRRFRVDLF